VQNIARSFDPRFGGFGRAPKFPPAPVLEFLLRRGERELTRRTLDGMALGGLHDLVGGGFHRYSVDDQWLVPHFDEDALRQRPARLGLPARGEGLGRRSVSRGRRAHGRLVLRELALDGGGFASAQDADTDGVEGLTFTWAPGEGAPEELLQPFEDGRFIIRGDLDEATRTRLFDLREQRPKPARDDKAIASWNGLMLATLAQAGRLEPAVALAEFLLGPLSSGGRLHRTWRGGVAKGTGYLEDYADVAYGLHELHVATGDPRWLLESRRLVLLAVELFADDEAGASSSRPPTASSSLRGRSRSTTIRLRAAMRCSPYVLLRLARIWGDDELERHALSVLRLVRDSLPKAPTAVRVVARCA